MPNKKAILRLEQGGKILEAGTSFDDFKAYEIEGLSGLEFDFSMTPTPQSPNTIINNKKPLPREITIHIVIPLFSHCLKIGKSGITRRFRFLYTVLDVRDSCPYHRRKNP